METPPPSRIILPLHDDSFRPSAKRRKSSIDSLHLSDLDISQTLSSRSLLSEPACEHVINGQKSIFKHDTTIGTFNTCHWRPQASSGSRSQEMYCCELNVDEPGDSDFLDLAVRLYTHRPVMYIDPSSQEYLNNMKQFYSEVYHDVEDQSMSRILLYKFQSNVLNNAARMAIQMNWQSLEMFNWTGSAITYVVSTADRGILNTSRRVVNDSTQTGEGAELVERSIYSQDVRPTGAHLVRDRRTQVNIPPTNETESDTDDSATNTPVQDNRERRIERQIERQREREILRDRFVENATVKLGLFLTAVQSPYLTTIETHSMHYLQHVQYAGFGNLVIKCQSNFANVDSKYGNLLRALRQVPRIISAERSYQFERMFQYRETSENNMLAFTSEVKAGLLQVIRYMVMNMLNARVEILGMEVPQKEIEGLLDEAFNTSPKHDEAYRMPRTIAMPNHYFQIVTGQHCTILTSYPFMRLHMSQVFQ